MWVTNAVKLYPLPWERVEELSAGSEIESLEWLSEKEVAQVEESWAGLPKKIWAEWLIALGITVLGIASGFSIVKRYRGALAFATAMSFVYVTSWFFRYSQHPERTFLESLDEAWNTVIFMGRASQYFFFGFYDVFLPVLHLVIACTFLYWIFTNRQSNN